MNEERLRHAELIRQHEAATKLQAAQRGKQGRRRARSRRNAGKNSVSGCSNARLHNLHNHSPTEKARSKDQQPKIKRKTVNHSTLQTGRGSQKPKSTSTDPKVPASVDEEQRRAAIKIQATHRGRRSRRAQPHPQQPQSGAAHARSTTDGRAQLASGGDAGHGGSRGGL